MTAAIDDPVLRAWAYLSRVAEPPCAELAALVGCVGPQEAADRVRRGLVNDDLARHTRARRGIDRAAEDLELLARRCGRLITPDCDEWPPLQCMMTSWSGEYTAVPQQRSRLGRRGGTMLTQVLAGKSLSRAAAAAGSGAGASS